MFLLVKNYINKIPILIKMKTWREPKIRRGIHLPKSKRMEGLYQKSPKKIGNNIKQLKEKQAKTLKKLNIDLKIVKSLIISLSGLNTLSENSITKIHEKRKKANMRIIRLTSDLIMIGKELNKLEKQYKKSLK